MKNRLPDLNIKTIENLLIGHKIALEQNIYSKLFIAVQDVAGRSLARCLGGKVLFVFIFSVLKFPMFTGYREKLADGIALSLHNLNDNGCNQSLNLL